jgi:hypothetical protein
LVKQIEDLKALYPTGFKASAESSKEQFKRQLSLYSKIEEDVNRTNRPKVDVIMEWNALPFSFTSIMQARNTIGRSSAGRLVINLKSYNSIEVSTSDGTLVDCETTLRDLINSITSKGVFVVLGAGASNQVNHTLIVQRNFEQQIMIIANYSASQCEVM